MGIFHIVMFGIDPSAQAADVQDVSLLHFLVTGRLRLRMQTQICDQMLALKDKCVHPETKKPYIKTAMGGKENSPEPHSVRQFITAQASSFFGY